MKTTGIIILAAGNSSRLGMPKQILLYQGRSLLACITDEAIKAKLHPIVVVTGANALNVSASIKNKKVTTVHNKAWEDGVGSGISLGISKLLSIDSAVQEIIVSVCDQPFLSAALFHDLHAKKLESGKGIVASHYNDGVGTPVLFSSDYFETLMKLNGQDGAIDLLRMHESDLQSVPFPLGVIDIDTIDDYRSFLRISENLQGSMA